MALQWEADSTTKTTYYLKEDGQGDPVATITGLEENLTLTAPTDDSKVISLTATELPNSGTVSISGEGYTISISEGLYKQEAEVGAYSSGSVPILSKETEGWKPNAATGVTSYTWTAADAAATIATVTGMKSDATTGAIEVSGDAGEITVTVKDGAVDTTTGTTTVSIIDKDKYDDYTIIRAAGFTVNNVRANSASALNIELKEDIDNNKATVEQPYSAYYEISNNNIQYAAASSATLATINGLQNDAVSLSGTTVNVSTSAVNSEVTLTNSNGATYKLAIAENTDSDPTKEGFADIDAKWEIDTIADPSSSTNKYISAGREEGWTLKENATKIEYTPEVSPTQLLTLGGDALKDRLTVEDLNQYTEVDTENKTVDVLAGLLVDEDASANNKTVTITGTGYKLTAPGSTTLFDETGTVAVTTPTNGGATVQKTQTAGWQADDADTPMTFTYKDTLVTNLATISGLNEEFSGTLELDGTFITLPEDALQNGAEINNATVDGVVQTYSLSIAAAVRQTAQDDTSSVTVSDVDDGTAKINYGLLQYWTTDGISVANHAAEAGKGSLLAQVMGLKTGADANDLEIGTDANEGKIILKEDALQAGASLANEAGQTFALAIDDDVLQEEEDDNTSITVGSVSNGTATINKGLKEYWTVEGLSIVNHAAETGKGTAVATITGLSTTAGTGDVTLNSKEITLGQNAVDTTEINLTDTNSAGYELVLGAGINTLSNTPTGGVTLSVGENKATVKQDYKEYWTLTGNNKVTYTGLSAGAGATVAEVTGLIENVSLSNVTLDDTTIKVKQDALKADATASAQITTGKDTYTLAFDGDVTAPNANDGDPYLDVSGAAGSKVVKVLQNKTAGWTLDKQNAGDTGNNKITYSTPNPDEYATISGLGDGVEVDKNISLSGNTITLEEGALKAGNVNLNDIENNGYTLALGTVTAPNAKPENEQAWDLSTSGTAIYKGKTTAGWTKTNDTTITYTAQETKNIVTITGLNARTTASDLTFDGNNIVVAGRALKQDTSTEVTITNEQTDHYTYSLSLADGIAAPATSIVDGTISTDFDSGTITITGTKSAGWAIESGKIKYTAEEENATIATVTGLKETAEKDVDYTVDTFNGVITLKESALKDNTNVVLSTTPGSNYDNPFKLQLQDSKGKETNSLGFNDVGYWEQKGSTAKYYTSAAAQGWEKTDDNNITWKASDSATLKVTLTNLDKNFTLGKSDSSLTYNDLIGTGAGTVADPFVAGVAVDGMTITLNKNILNTNKNNPIGIEYADENYSVELNMDDSTDGFVLTKAETKGKVWEYGTTTTYKEVEQEYWTLDNAANTITYHPQTNETVLATITGLKSGVSAGDIAVNDDDDNNIDTDGKFKITLNKNALNNTDVNITSTDYKLALQETAGDTKVDAPVFGGEAWKLNGAKTIATYTAKVTTAGYTAASDGSSITYTAATTGDNTITLAEVTGLNGNEKLKVSADGSKIGIDNSGTISDGLTLDANKVITLKSDVLGTSNVAVTGTNYTLAFNNGDTAINKVTATEVDDGEGNITVTVTPPNNEEVWRVNDTTATYKTITPAYYTLGIGATAITYTPEADVAGGTLATVTGLKSGLTVADGGQSLEVTDENGTVTTSEVLKINSEEIVLKKEALGNANITLTTDEDYTLSFGAEAENLKPSMDDPNALMWALDGTTKTTAHLRGLLKEGYEVATDGKSITYTDKNPVYTFATLTGLKSGLTDADVNDGITENFTDPNNPVITLDKTVLGTSTTVPVAVTGKKIAEDVEPTYTLALATGANAPADSAENINVWKFSGTTATYHNATEAYYEVDTANESKSINYIARVVDSTPVATLTGLKSGLTVVDDKIAGIDTEDDGATFTISRDVLGTSKVTISSESGPSFTLAGDAAPEQTSEYYWTVSGTTAKYQFNSAAGYTQAEANADIEYQQARSGNSANTVVTISGLKNGINKAIVEQGIVPDQANEVFTLDGTVLGTGSAKITLETGNGADESRINNYALALESVDLGPQSGHMGWQYKDGELTLSEYKTAGYTIDGSDNKIINYTGGTFDANNDGTDDNEILKVTGLKANLTVKNLSTSTQAEGAQIDGIVVSGNINNPIITLSKNVLTTDKNTPVEITEISANGMLQLNTNANSTGKVAEPAYSKAWTIKNGTATLTETITEGYTVNESKVWYNPKEVVTTKISGLKTDVKVSEDNQKIGIETVSGQSKTYSGITAPTFTTDATTGKPAAAKSGDITLDSTVLAAQTTVTLTNSSTNKDSDYHLVLSGVTPQTADNRSWYKAANATTATYKEITAAGYTQTNDYKYTYNKTAVDTVYATLKGLDKTVTEETLNNSATIEVSAHTPDNPNTTENEFAVGTFTIKDKSIFGKNNVTLASTNYVMAFTNNNDNAFKVADISNEEATWTYNATKGTANLVAGKTEGWAFKTTTKNGSTITDHKTIVYTKAAPVTLATVSGLAKSTTNNPITLSSDGKSLTYKDGGTEYQSLTVSFDGNAGTILVDAGVLTTKTLKSSNIVESNANVSVTTTAAAKKLDSTYSFKLKADGDVYLPEDSSNYWSVDKNGKATYKYDTSAGYTPNATDTTLTYSTKKSTVIATISGLDKTKVGETENLEQIAGIRVTAPVEAVEADPDNGIEAVAAQAGVFTLWDKTILGNKVTLTTSKGYNYELGVAPEIATADGGKKWYYKNGTATYRDFKTPGFALSTNKKTVESKGEIAGTTYVTLSGLAKITDKGDYDTLDGKINGDNLLIVNEDKTITVSTELQGTSTITLANRLIEKKTRTNPAVYDTYTIDANSYTDTARKTETPTWTVSNGTATLKQTTTAGFTLGTLNTTNGKQTLAYAKAATPTIATVKGLATNLAFLTAEQATAYNTANGTSITAGFNFATTTGTGKNKVTTYTAPNNANVLTYNTDTKLITVTDKALAAKNVTISGGYKLALDNEVTKTAVDKYAWVVNGTTATYKNYKEAYYTLNTNSTTITYVKPTTGTTYATVTGLKKGVTAAELNDNVAWSDSNNNPTNGGVLTLDARHLGTSTVKIATTLKNTGNVDGFTLALQTTGDNAAAASTVTAGSWSNNLKGTVTLSGTRTEGFAQEFGGKTLTYINANTAAKPATIATITGLSNSANVTANAEGVITLTANDLTTKNVAITTNMGNIDYKLSIDSIEGPEKNATATASASDYAGTEANPKIPKAAGWTVSGATGTLKGYVTNAGYTLAASGKSITYTGKTATSTSKTGAVSYKDTTTLATIKGLKSTANKSDLISSNTINLTKDNTNGNLTITGGTYAVKVDDTYTGKSITGSAGADDITAEGTKLVITGGKGDDIITLKNETRTSSTANTLVYSNGDGNDVVVNFTASDKLQVKSGAVSVGKVGNDVVVKVGTGSINLGSYADTTIDIYNAKNVKTTYAIDGAYTGGGGNGNILLEDNNYSMDAANLSSLVQGDSASYTPYDFSSSFSLTKEDKLTPQISYSGTSDKK